jgi:hypothetical protein
VWGNLGVSSGNEYVTKLLLKEIFWASIQGLGFGGACIKRFKCVLKQTLSLIQKNSKNGCW